MKVKDLKPSTYNPRKISPKKLSALGKSMKEFGDLSGIIFNRQTGNLIGGHQRIKHLRPEWEIQKREFQDELGTVARGFVKTPLGDWVYREVDWPQQREKAANLAANRHGGEFDLPQVEEVFSDLKELGADLELTGFSDEDFKKMRLEHEELELQPYRMTHILLSFPPEKMIDLQTHLDEILKIPEVEYEQGSNG
jgi:hypothetical protein